MATVSIMAVVLRVQQGFMVAGIEAKTTSIVIRLKERLGASQDVRRKK
tara:strand:- start:90 stop:233 length:144 start_codon:yes stop_codon:yes gene_type:complete